MALQLLLVAFSRASLGIFRPSGYAASASNAHGAGSRGVGASYGYYAAVHGSQYFSISVYYFLENVHTTKEAWYEWMELYASL